MIKKTILLALTLHVEMDPAKMDDNDETVKQEVNEIVDGIQKHFNGDLTNVPLSNSRIVTSRVKLEQVVDSVTELVQDMN